MAGVCSASFSLGRVTWPVSWLLGPASPSLVNPSVPAQGKGDSIFTSCHPGCLTTMGVISRNWPFFRKRLHLIQAAIKFSSKQKAFQEHLASYKSSTTSTQEKKDFADEPIWVFCIFH